MWEDSYKLFCEKENSLETELAAAKVEHVLERRTEEVNDHHIVVMLSAEPSC